MQQNHVFHDLMSYRILQLLDAGCYVGDGPNPITQAIAQGRGQELIDASSEIGLSIAATCCQMLKLNRERGPEGDGKPKALRRHWYSWYKSEFAQPLAMAIGQYTTTAAGVKQIDDRKWSSLLSKTYGRLVGTGQVTYRDLWVEDASRMMQGFWDELYPGINIAVAVEKDSLFGDFVTAAQALGAKALISGKGKQSKAATEKLLRDHFGWNDGFSGFTEETPLRVIHVSDYDYDGQAVIGPTFAEQARRYTEHVDEARIGIQPSQVPTDDWGKRSYKVKVSHRGSQDWANEKALFSVGCQNCGHNWLTVGSEIPNACPECWSHEIVIDTEQPAGFEVEALTTRTFYPYFVDALLSLIPFLEIVHRLRQEAKPDPYHASDQVTDALLEQNDAYQETKAEMQALEEKLDDFRRRVNDHILNEAYPKQEDYYNQGDTPEPDDFKDYVQEANGHAYPWRPFSKDERTAALIKDLQQDETVLEVLDWTFN